MPTHEAREALSKVKSAALEIKASFDTDV